METTTARASFSATAVGNDALSRSGETIPPTSPPSKTCLDPATGAVRRRFRGSKHAVTGGAAAPVDLYPVR